MPSSYTVTASLTNTFTEARVRHVMAKVLDDLVMVAACHFASIERVTKWCEEVTMVLLCRRRSPRDPVSPESPEPGFRTGLRS